MVNYFVPADGDEEDHCNIFPMRKAAETVTLADVKKVSESRLCLAVVIFLVVQNFPIPGKYHFRFKHAYESTFGKQDHLISRA